MKLKEAIQIKESLEELIADPETDFGPAYELIKRRQQKAIKLIKRHVKELKALENPKVGCVVCDKPAKWVRHTQFAGEHPYCKEHAKAETDFGHNDSYEYWAKA